MFDDYLEGLSPAEQSVLRALIDHVSGIVPDAETGRSYGLPAFRYRGKPLLGFAVTKNHLSLHPFSAEVIESVTGDLAGFDVSKGTVRFTVDRPVPDSVVTQMVTARMAEIDG